MTSSFDEALKVVLEHEGGWTDDPRDPGGATNFGVSLRLLRSLGDLDGDDYQDGDLDRDGDVDADDVRAMTRDQAAAVYRGQWWDRYGYWRLAEQATATKVFDLAVNMGPRQAHLIAQRACRALSHAITEDGVLGPQTLGALNGVRDFQALPPLRSEASGFYRALVAKRAELGPFLRGWLTRAYS